MMKKRTYGKLKFGFYTALTVGIFAVGGFSVYRTIDGRINDTEMNNEYDASKGSHLETDLGYYMLGRQQLLQLNAKMSLLTGQHEMNEVQRLKNGYLTMNLIQIDDAVLQEDARQVAGFKNYLASQGIDCLYVMSPYRNDPYDSQLVSGDEDYADANTDLFLADLDALGVDNLDMRAAIHEDGLNQYDYLYRTDHHWNTQAGMYAYSKIQEILAGKYGYSVNTKLTDPNNYSQTVYENWALGFFGQRTGETFAGGADDVTVLLPTFSTSLLRADTQTTGSLEELYYNMDQLQERDLTTSFYDRFFNEGYYINQGANNGKKVLFISNSMGWVVEPYMAMDFAETYFYYEQGTGELTKELIEDYQPDLVVILSLPNWLFEGSGAYEYQNFED